MGPGGASQIGPVPLLRCHAIPLPCYPLPIPCHPILPFPSHPNTPSHPTVGNLSLVLSKGTRGREREGKKRGDPCPWATPPLPGLNSLGSQSLTPSLFPKTSLPLGRVHILMPLHSIQDQRSNQEAPGQFPLTSIPEGSCPCYTHTWAVWTSWQYSGATPRSTASTISTYVNVLISQATSQSTSAPTVCLPTIYGQISSFHAAGGCV